MQLDVVSVIEYIDSDITSVYAFSNDPEGVEQAKCLFKEYVNENDAEVTTNELKGFVEDGYYEQGEYQLFLRV